MMEDDPNNINDDETYTVSSSRFPTWTALTIFSTVSLIAHVSTDNSNDGSAEKWVTAVTSISMSIGFCAMLSHFVAAANFVGTPTEGGVAFFIVVFWAAGLPVIMNPNNAIAVNEAGIKNANLYFFAWASFISNLYILAEMAKVSDIADVSATPPKTAKWYGLFAASLIVLGSSAKAFEINDCKGRDISECHRTNYAISLGAIGTVFCLALSFLSSRGAIPSLVLELTVSFIMFVMYVFGVGFITFGSGPGTSLGNLYFSTWVGFIISMLLFAECMKQFSEENSDGGGEIAFTTGTGGPPSRNPEIIEEAE